MNSSMNQSNDDHSRLEQFISRTCRAQPPLRAPGTLGLRVFAEIERRAALPSWRRPFGQWPMALRAAFLLICIGAVQASLSLVFWSGPERAVARMAAPASRPLSWIHDAHAWVLFLGSLFNDIGTTILHSIPPLWLYGSATSLLSMYGLLAGLGAVAYRTLYATR